MADIFISYAREDQPRVKPLVRLLERQGWTVFWDLNIPPGDNWRSWIGRHLDEARCLIVAWSIDSIDSRWVQEEADECIRAKKPLIPILLDNVLPPLGFRQFHAADFRQWDGKAEALVSVNVLEWLAQKLGPPPVAQEQRKVEEEARRKRQEEAERLKARDEAAKQDAALDAKRKADAKKASQAEGEAAKRKSKEAPGPSTTKARAPSQAPGTVYRDVLKDGSEGPEMVVIPAGSFWMGSPEDEPERLQHEGPRHRVAIHLPFALGKTAVTFEEYDRFVEATLFRKRPKDLGWGRSNRPVINVSWDDAVAYAEWLSEQTGKRYRLPTEAEWEYACCAGTETSFSTGSCIDTDQANYNGSKYHYSNCGAKTGVYRAKTVPTGSLPPNPWGLHEMHGNVWEWVQDCWHESYEGAPDDGIAWEEADGGNCGQHVLRGGSWSLGPWTLRSAYRYGSSADGRNDSIGFRLAQDLD